MLSAASTRDDIFAQYRDNSLYETDSTGATARLFIQAARVMLSLPQRSRGRLQEAEWDWNAVRMQLDKATAWLNALLGENPSTEPAAVPRQFSFERSEC